jgi:hypothetical protein
MHTDREGFSIGSGMEIIVKYSYLVSLILFSPYILIKKGEQLHDLEKILCGRIRSRTEMNS